jgi:signal peptidase I
MMLRRDSLLRVVVEPLAIAVVLAFAVRTIVHIYTIPSASMFPTLHEGDQIVVTPYLRSGPSRGDIIVFRAPRGDEMMVKRIVAEPGDLIESRMGGVSIGGHALAEPYLAEEGESGGIPSQIVPSGCYFVMGDNRADSLDSRSWGVLPRDLIVGKARMVLWSSPHAGGRPAAHASTRVRVPTRTGSTSLRLFVPIE